MKSANRLNTLVDLINGKPKTIYNLTTVSLSGDTASELDYLLVDEAIESKEVVVKGASDDGSVPELRMTNLSTKVLLVADGRFDVQQVF